MNAFIEKLLSYKSKILGIVSALAAILVFTGVLNPDSCLEAKVSDLYEGIALTLTALSGFILLFTKPAPAAKSLIDVVNRLKNYKSTIIGIFTALATLLVILGPLSPEHKEGVLFNVDNIYEGITLVVGSLNAVLLIFSKD